MQGEIIVESSQGENTLRDLIGNKKKKFQARRSVEFDQIK